MTRIRNFIPTSATTVQTLLKGWNLEEPGPEIQQTQAGQSLVVSGWAIGHKPIKRIAIRTLQQTHYIDLNLARPDVIGFIFGNEDSNIARGPCGFSIEIDIELSQVASFDVGLTFDDAVEWVGTFFYEDAQKVLIGKNQWLFLDNDSNHSVDQFTGRLDITSADQARWLEYIADLQSVSQSRKFDWLMVLAPSKEFVFNDYYPHLLSPNNTPDQFRLLFETNSKILYPLQLLAGDRELSYWKGDTHWTDYGAYLVFRETLENFKLPIDQFDRNFNFKFIVENTVGDLSEKIPNYPPFPKIKLLEPETDTSEVTFDNHIPNNGKIIVHENPHAVCPESLTIFGSSSSYNLLKFYKFYFKRVVFIHSAAEIDLEVLNHERSPYVLLQSNARFINVSPGYLGSYSVKNAIITKLASLSQLEIEAIMNIQENSSASNEAFYSSMSNFNSNKF